MVAHLLSQQFPNTAVEAVQIAEPDELLSEHLTKALTPVTYDYAALGPNSTEKWDYVILQVWDPTTITTFHILPNLPLDTAWRLVSHSSLCRKSTGI